VRSSDETQRGTGEFQKQLWDDNHVAALDLPLAVGGVPHNTDVEADALTVIFEGSGGRMWKTGAYEFQGVPRNLVRVGENVFDGIVSMDPMFFNQEATLRGSLYLTLFGNPQVQTVPLQATPVSAIGGLRCALGFLNQLFCSSRCAGRTDWCMRGPRKRTGATFRDRSPTLLSRPSSTSIPSKGTRYRLRRQRVR
jgi:hypothetical protein